MKPESVEISDASSAEAASEKALSIMTEDEVLKLLKKVVNSERFDLLDYSFNSIDKLNGYLGLYYTLVTLVKFSDRTEEHTFFIKTQLPPGGIQYKFMMEMDVFRREARMYNEIIPQMLGVGKRRSKWAPVSYFVHEEALVLEDLSAQGYVMPDKYVKFDRDHCALLLETLARFHAGSFILEEKLKSQDKTILDVYGDVLDEPLYKESDVSKKSFRSCILGINSLIDLVHQLEDEEKSELKRRAEKWFENLARILKPSKRYRNVICHRDLWANNFLFKYNDTSGKPEACRLIDLQFICYGAPAIDYMFALHLTTDRETRNRHKASFLRIYYDTLKKELETEGLDIKDCMEWSNFLRNCEETRLTAVVYALVNLPIMLLDVVVREKLFTQSEFLKQTLYNDRSAVLCQQFFDVKPFRERMTDAILEAHEVLPNYVEEEHCD